MLLHVSYLLVSPQKDVTSQINKCAKMFQSQANEFVQKEKYRTPIHRCNAFISNNNNENELNRKPLLVRI